ncbi:MAG: VOC family protein [Anaerolineales bacterium]|nr:VOC family protein [Anaerolineales bacterium]
MSIHPDTHMGAVSLTVADLARSVAFYQQVIGLQLRQQTAHSADFGLLRLTENKTARPVSQTTGLFHFALLVPTRRDLALVFRHLVQAGVDLGASDHLVSEALYLDDPDGNGIEIYADQPREAWSFVGGELQMATKRLNVPSLLSELETTAVWSGLPSGTKMGHVHLRVADIPQAKQFYGQVLGFDHMMDYGAQASFFSAGGYHHHLGLNSWQSLNAPPPPPNATGLDYFTIVTPNTAVVRQALEAAEVSIRPATNGFFIHDPFHNQIFITEVI